MKVGIYKRWIVLVAVMALFFLFGTIQSNAETVASGDCSAYDGDYGDCVEWELNNNGTLSIYGDGEMKDYVSGGSVFTPYSSEIKKIIIDKGVTRIGDYAFQKCRNVTEISILDGMESVGMCAFESCNSLEWILMPGSINQIETYAVSFCPKLTDIYYGSSESSWNRIDNSQLNTEFEYMTIHYDSKYGPEYKEYREALKYGDYNWVYARSLDNERMWVEISFLRLTGTDMVLATYDQDDGIYTFSDSGWDLSGYITISGNKMIIELDEVEKFYFDWDLSHFINGLHHEFVFYSSYGTTDGEYSETSDFELCGYTYSHNLDYYAENLGTSTFDDDLCSLMAAIARCAYSLGETKDMYEKLGFRTSDYDVTAYSKSTNEVIYSMGKKTNSNGTTVILVDIKGTDITKASDVLKDVNVTNLVGGDYSAHQGFNDSAEYLLDMLESFLGSTPEYDENTKYFITGHSLGGAAANLLAAKLGVLVGKDSIYNYNFACPNTVTSNKSILDDPDAFNPVNSHSNMFNICRSTDRVPSLPGLESSVLLDAKEQIQYGWDVFQCFRTKRDYYWGRWGITKWFNDGIWVLLDAHSMDNYLQYVSTNNPQYTVTPTYGDNFTYIMNNVFIFCPVDAQVVDENGTVIAAVIDDEPVYYNNSFGKVFITTAGNEKCISYPSDANYRIKISSTGTGTMDYAVAQGTSSDELYDDAKIIQSVSLLEGKSMRGVIDNDSVSNSKLFVLDDENAVYEVQSDGTETPHEHTYGEWKTVTSATESSVGVKRRTCTECGSYETATIDKLKSTGTSAPAEIVDLPAVKITKPKAAKKSVTVKWKKVSKKNLKKIKKVQIQIATDAAFNSVVKTTTVSAKKTSKKVKGLMKGMKYYVRIRGINGSHVSAWSSVKSFKAK